MLFRAMETATVLIVDDNPESLSALGELLRPEFRVLAANSGQRGLDVIKGGARPDLVLLDIMMPDVSGYEVLKRLRAASPPSDIPVIFVTALDANDDEERGLALGAADYITKPSTPAIVRARVRTHIELKRARDRLSSQNALLEAEVARRMGENQHIQDVSILALARLAEIRDVETGNHLRRTREYLYTLAMSLKGHLRFAQRLDDAAIALMSKSALLHDIGKVGIPDDILHKPGRLTPAEWAVMQTHAQLGADAIEQAGRGANPPIAFLACAAEIARHHHERWDGTGYPDGLAGDAIPVAARLMALADVFDALISRRVYKEPMAFSTARDIIASERGSHFDPDIVDAFLAQFDVFCAIARRYADSASSPPNTPAQFPQRD
jgi:putative two-component system response regulator